MPDNTPQVQQWDPVAEFKQQWPNAKLNDGQILQNLQDPSKFRSAFPHYTGVTDDEIKQKMQAYSPLAMPAQPKGDVRPSTAQVFDKQANTQQTNREISSFYGRMIPDAAVPYLSAVNKYAVEPFDKMAQLAGKTAGFAARSVMDPVSSEKAQIPGQTPSQQYQAVDAATQRNPKVAGVLEGAGEIVGGTAGDPRMWPFAMEGATKSALSKLAAQGFTTQMLTSAVSSFPDIKDAVKRNDTFEAARLITSAIGAGALGALGLKGEAKSNVENLTRTALDKSTGANPIPAKTQDNSVNARMREIQNKPLTASLLSTDPQAPNQQRQLDFTTKAPTEAHAPMDQGGASKVANAPVVDRQAALQNTPEQEFTALVDRHKELTARQRSGNESDVKANAKERSQIENRLTQLADKHGLMEDSDDPARQRLQGNIPSSLWPIIKPEAKADPLVAPNPADFVGKDAPVSLGRFPSSAIENMARGRTLGGVDRFTLNAPDITSAVSKAVLKPESTEEPVLVNSRTNANAATSTQSDGMKPIQYSTDNNGTRWAKSGDLDITIPKSIKESDVPEYTRLKLQEQTILRKQGEYGTFKAKQAEGIQSPPSTGPISPELPQTLRNNFDRIAKLSRDADLAESDQQADDINAKRSQLADASKSMLHEHMRQLSGDQLAQLRDTSAKEAEHLDAQSKAIRDLTEATIRNRGVKGEIADLRAPGGPVRYVVDPETGERSLMKPDAKASRGARSVFDELQGRVPTSDFNQLKINAKPEGLSDEEFAQHVSHLQEERTKIKGRISDAVTVAAETGAPLSTMNIDEHVDALKQIEGLLGKFTEPAEAGRRPNLQPEVDEQGAIKAPEAIKSWSLDRARLAIGTKLKQMPTDEEFFQHADMRAEKAGLHRTVAEEAQKLLDTRKSQSGVLGEVGVKGQVKRVSLADQVPEDKELLKRALKAKIFGVTVDDQFGAGEHGFLAKDGKTWIDTGHMTHDDVAETLMPDVAKNGSALRAMLDKGWVRKADYTNYEARNLDGRTFDTIDMDLMRSGRYGRAINIDTMKPNGRPGTISLDDGWGDRFKGVREASEAFIRKGGWANEQGAIKGTTLAASSTVGGLVGAAIGAHFNEPYAGMAIGWGAGFVGPALLDRAGFWKTVNNIKPTLTSLGINAHDWLAGPRQLDPINADMKPILDAQRRDVRGPVKAMLTRVAQLPADFARNYIDKFVFINDRPTALGKFLMSADPRGKAFRDLRGKLDVDNSPYVSAWLAAGGGNGWAEAHLQDYKGIYRDAQGGKLVNNLNEYLNLKGYQRVLEVMQERIQEHDANIQQLRHGLQSPNLPLETEAGMRKALRQSISDRQDVIDRLVNREVVPAPYDSPSIQRDLQNLQTTLGPQKFTEMKGLADRVFGMNRKVLDMVHDAGIVSDEAYQKYTARGDEYVPMQRIYDQIAGNIEKTMHKSGSPLYLREQGVINTLRGSERINRDPIIASADANLEAIREVLRNRVTKDYLKIAYADSQGVGSYFKQAKQGYKVQPGEGLIGYYEGGQQHTFVTPSWLSESLKNVSPATMDMVGAGPLRYFGNLLRSGATVGNLGWSIPNAMRHWGDMALMSEAGLKDIKTLPKDAAALLNEWRKSVYSATMKDGRWQEFMRSGAAYSTLQRAITPEEHLDPTALGWKQKLMSGRIIDTVKDFNTTVEDATKLTTFSRLRQNGYSEKAAAWETRRFGGGPDFAKQGMNTGFVNLVSMFFNAHMQYVGRAIARSVEEPGRMATVLAAVTAMNMMMVQHNISQKDENGNPLWRKVLYNDRENNWVVLTPYTNPVTGSPVTVKIPKPSVLKFLSNPIENMLYKMAGAEDRSATQLSLQALGNVLPGQFDLQEDELGKSVARGAVSSLNPVLRGPVEQAMNYKTTGSGGSIVPTQEQKIDSQFQYGPNASQVSKDIGQGGTKGAVAGAAEGGAIGYLLSGWKGAALGGALGGVTGTFGVSPRRAEHIIDTTTAGVGRIATGLLDPFLGGVKQTKTGGGADRLVNMPGVGPMASRFVGSGAIDQQEQTAMHTFYRSSQQAQVPMDTLRFLTKNHPEQVKAYIRQNQDKLWQGKIAVEMSKRLGQIENAQRQIEQNNTMEQSEKASILQTLHGVKMQALTVFNKVITPQGQVAANPGQGQGGAR